MLSTTAFTCCSAVDGNTIVSGGCAGMWVWMWVRRVVCECVGVRVCVSVSVSVSVCMCGYGVSVGVIQHNVASHLHHHWA